MLRNLIKPHMKVPYLSHAQTLICDIGVGSGICNDSKYIKATPDFFLCTGILFIIVCIKIENVLHNKMYEFMIFYMFSKSELEMIE